MSFAEFVAENQLILISLLAVAGPMLLAFALFTINKVRGLASIMKDVGTSEEDELMNLAAVAEKPTALALEPLAEVEETSDSDTDEEEDEDDAEAEGESPQSAEEDSDTPSDIQSILNDVFVDDEAQERYQVLVGDAEPLDARLLAQFADEIAERLEVGA